MLGARPVIRKGSPRTRIDVQIFECDKLKIEQNVGYSLF
jgi:hypothetical protein